MLTSLNLRTKIIIGFVFPLLFIFVGLLLVIQSFNQLNNYSIRLTEIEIPKIILLEEMKLAGSRLISSTNEHVLDDVLTLDESSDGEIEEIEEAEAFYLERLDLYRQITPGDNADQVERTGVALLDNAELVMTLVEQGASQAEITEAREQFEDLEEEFLEVLDNALALDQASFETAQAQVLAYQNNILILLIVLGALIVLGIGVVIAYLTRSITVPLLDLTRASIALQTGELNARAKVESQDEVGQLGQTFNQMADRIAQLISDLQGKVNAEQVARLRAEKSDQVKSAFLASMSHELRTPLNAIINFTKFVVKGDLGPINDEQRETLTDVVNSGKHLLDLINDVLDMSKIESGSLTLFVVDGIAVGPIVQQTITTAKGLLNDKPITIETEIDDPLPPIRGDRQRITQILLNILSNAVKFTEKGTIKVKVCAVERDLVISVSDTGIGIAAEDYDAVFEAFNQTASGLRQGGGTGLGMPITRSLIEAHHGTIHLTSVVGVGSTFTVTLPIQSEQLIPTLSR
ncbi:MAG: HAMP domain-containing histidine kinase [Anaerolineae bacterium]|nr:HAMP domain-containing histidine kinase [Anaerolineae bacterium]